MTLLDCALISLAVFCFWGFCLSYMSRFKHPEPPLPPPERTITPNDWRGKP